MAPPVGMAPFAVMYGFFRNLIPALVLISSLAVRGDYKNVKEETIKFIAKLVPEVEAHLRSVNQNVYGEAWVKAIDMAVDFQIDSHINTFLLGHGFDAITFHLDDPESPGKLADKIDGKPVITPPLEKDNEDKNEDNSIDGAPTLPGDSDVVQGIDGGRIDVGGVPPPKIYIFPTQEGVTATGTPNNKDYCDVFPGKETHLRVSAGNGNAMVGNKTKKVSKKRGAGKKNPKWSKEQKKSYKKPTFLDHWYESSLEAWTAPSKKRTRFS